MKELKFEIEIFKLRYIIHKYRRRKRLLFDNLENDITVIRKYLQMFDYMEVYGVDDCEYYLRREIMKLDDDIKGLKHA